MIKSSLLISTYNWPEALNLILLSVNKQSVLPNEIIIADDGSTNETKAVITKFQDIFKIPIKHIWHEDSGFRKTIILNKAIAQTENEFIIQIDGDIILHKHFIKNHIQNITEGVFIHGSRVFLSKNLTSELLKNKIFNLKVFSYGLSNRFNTIYSKFLSSFFTKDSKELKGTRGSNFSFFKKDFLAVNGYNEDMTGWGKEDSELSARLLNNGLLKRKIKFVGLTYHLYHKSASREGLNINTTILENVVTKKITWCENGINKYL